MKSLLLSRHYFPPQVGGISSMMAGIAHALGPERVCCLTGVSDDGRELALGGVRVRRSPRAFRGTRWVQGASLAAALAPLWLHERPRALQLATVYEGEIALPLRRRLGTPFLVYAHGHAAL